MTADGNLGMFVQSRGTQRSIVAGAAGGAVGRMLSDRKAAPGPLRLREVGYISVAPATLTLFRAKKRVLLGGFRATEEVLATMPRARVTSATYQKGKVGGTFEVAFDDGTVWAFDVPRVGNKVADQAAAAVAQTDATGSGEMQP